MTGKVNAHLAYHLISSCSLTDHPDRDLVLIRKCNLPLKVICFIWLCLSNRINTWDNLLQKSWIGPNRCNLCYCEAESVNHLFTDCMFTKNVICGLNTVLHHPVIWNEPTYLQNLVNWLSGEKELLHLPLLMTWKIWTTRNKVIFRNASQSWTSLFITF